jgi:outer membrane protein TolC
MKKIFIIGFLILSISAVAQEQLSLQDCYALVNKNYPLAKQNDLLAQQNELDIAVINKEKLPQLDLLVQATYQSDVTQMPLAIPGTQFEAPNLDQYKANLSVNQLIYSGEKVNTAADLKTAELKTQQKQVEVNLYQLKKQVNQLYFSILNLQERKALLEAKRKLLNTKLNEVKAGVEFGTLLPSSDAFFEVELLKLEQQFVELDFNKASLINTLSELIGTEISPTIQIENPTITTNTFLKINRPELELFELKKEQIETSEALISTQNIPKIVGFATGGFGNPGLNMLENAFKTYYWVGVRLNWNVFDWNATKKERESLLINKEIIDNEAEIFNLNTNIELANQNSEIRKINAFIDSDQSIIELQKKIVSITASQLKNGVITAADYVTEITNLYEAENKLSTHQIQLLLAKANYNITQGNTQ